MTKEESLATDIIMRAQLQAMQSGVQPETWIKAVILNVASGALAFDMTREHVDECLTKAYEACEEADAEIDAEELTKKTGGKKQ